jgi:2-methylcitrate dehydratase PrpD
MNTLLPSVTQQLAQWGLGLKAGDIPASIRQRAQTSFLDTVGVAIAGSATRVGILARHVGLQAMSSGSSTIFCDAAPASAPTAAFVNGACAHALDFDDNCYAGVVHGSAVIAPAALAVAQMTNASGQDLLTAFIAGSECEYAFGAATQNVLYAKGWWTTGVLGPIGSAVASCHLLGLSAAQMTSALGLAIAGAGGSKAAFGTDGKPLLAGRAAEAGVVCALLAAQGAIGPEQAVESTNGFIRLVNAGQFDSASLARLGKEWFAQSPGVDIKRIPVCLSSHAAVDAVLALIAAHHIDLKDIESISCDVPPMVRRNLVYDRPTTVQQAQFSMQFPMAVSLLHGTLTLAHLNQGFVEDREIGAWMSRVQMTTSTLWNDAQLCLAAPEGAQVELRLTSGAVFKAFRGLARGAVSDPLSPGEIKDKFITCVVPVLGNNKAQPLFDALQNLDGPAPVRALFDSVAFGAGTP